MKVIKFWIPFHKEAGFNKEEDRVLEFGEEIKIARLSFSQIKS